jgi:hypothetical protein
MSKNIILSTIYKLVFKHNTNIAYVGQSTNINSRFKNILKMLIIFLILIINFISFFLFYIKLILH